MQLHVVYTKEGVYLAKCGYSSWRDIQDIFEGYMASEGLYGEIVHAVRVSNYISWIEGVISAPVSNSASSGGG